MGRSEPLKSRNPKCKSTADATGCEQCLRIDVELLPAGWHPFYACACLWSGAWVSLASDSAESPTGSAAARRLYIAFHIRFSASLHAKTKKHSSENARGANALGPPSACVAPTE